MYIRKNKFTSFCFGARYMMLCLPLFYRYLWSGLIVVLGIYLNLYSKNKVAWDARIDEFLKNIGIRKRHWQLGAESLV